MNLRPIQRTGTFWRAAFVTAYGEILRRVPAGEALLQGPKYAALAKSFADDCERVRLASEAEGPECSECQGIGCAVCRYTGRAFPGAGLVAPAADGRPVKEVQYTCLEHGGGWPESWGTACPVCGAHGSPLYAFSPSVPAGTFPAPEGG
jgi:hypothetical protein